MTLADTIREISREHMKPSCLRSPSYNNKRYSSTIGCFEFFGRQQACGLRRQLGVFDLGDDRSSAAGKVYPPALWKDVAPLIVRRQSGCAMNWNFGNTRGLSYPNALICG